MYFGDWSRAHTIIDRFEHGYAPLRPDIAGYITFFGEKRLATSVRDPNALVRYRSTGTAT